MKKLSPAILILLFIACKPLVRQMPYQPTVATETSGKRVAKQLLLLTNSPNDKLEEYIKSDPDLEKKLNEILASKARRQTVVDTLRNISSWSDKLIMWKNSHAPNKLNSDAEVELERVLTEDKLAPIDISVEKHNPKILWQRNFDNNKQSTLATLNFGALTALIYTVHTPDKPLDKVDNHNLFADTVVVYADNLDATLNAARDAIDVSEKKQKELESGWYTLGRLLSPVRLYREAAQIGKAFIFSKDQDVGAGNKRSHELTFTAFGAYLATAIFVSDDMISIAKAAAGKDITRLSKWIHDKGGKISEWRIFSNAGNVDRGTQHMARFGRRVVKLGLAIPMVIAVHIIGRVMQADVDTNEEDAPTP